MLTTTYTPVSLDKINTLDSTTASILEFARALVIDQKYLPRADWNNLIQLLGWSKKTVNEYIKIGIAFFDVEISRLININTFARFMSHYVPSKLVELRFFRMSEITVINSRVAKNSFRFSQTGFLRSKS